MSTPAARIFGRGRHRKRAVPIFICCYHKVGTVLLLRIVRSLCAQLDWSFRLVAGRIESPPTDADIVVLLHSLVNLDSVAVPYVGAHFIRDPRDVVVSGYQYHLRCQEPWCINADVEPKSPIQFPKIPYSQEYRSQEWKAEYLQSLQGKSYQQNLQSLSEREGLLFEMHHYGRWTIDSMLDWNYARPNVLELRFETLMSQYDGTFRRLFESFGLSGQELETAMRVVAAEDLGRKSDEQIQSMDHVTSRDVTRWPQYFEAVHRETFQQLFGDALVRLGYEDSGDW